MKITALEADALKFADLLAMTAVQKHRVALCVEKRNELQARLSTPAAARRYLTVYRAAVKNHPLITKTIALLNSLKIAKKANEKIQKAYEVGIRLRTQKQAFTVIPAAAVPAIITKALELLASENKLKTAAALMLLTGRRTVEIFLTGAFKAVPKNANFATFSGQAKKREGDSGRPYKIPLLTNCAGVIAAQKWLHLQYSNTEKFNTAAAVNSRISSELSRIVKKEFGAFLGEDAKPHDLRKAYISICYYLFADDNKIDFQGYACKYLGHADAVAGLTSEAYNKYKIQ
jgi:integrase